MLARATKQVAPARRVAATVAVLTPSFVRPLPSSPHVPRPPSGRAEGSAARIVARSFSSTAGRKVDEATSTTAAERTPDADTDAGADGAIPAEELTSVGSHEKEHEHAVISAFDLFSIGGGHARLASLRAGVLQSLTARTRHSRPKLVSYRRPYAGWEDLHRRLGRPGPARKGIVCSIPVRSSHDVELNADL